MSVNDDFDLLDSSCTCWCGHPPCSYCVDTYDCESCGHRNYAVDCYDHKKHGFICESCQVFHGPKGFIYWFLLVVTWIYFVLFFPMWVVIHATYTTYIDYKKAGYQLPGFTQFLYEYNLTQTTYTKLKK